MIRFFIDQWWARVQFYIQLINSTRLWGDAIDIKCVPIDLSFRRIIRNFKNKFFKSAFFHEIFDDAVMKYS